MVRTDGGSKTHVGWTININQNEIYNPLKNKGGSQNQKLVISILTKIDNS